MLRDKIKKINQEKDKNIEIKRMRIKMNLKNVIKGKVMKLQEKNNQKSIKHRNRELKVEELNRIKKIKLNKCQWMKLNKIQTLKRFKSQINSN